MNTLILRERGEQRKPRPKWTVNLPFKPPDEHSESQRTKKATSVLWHFLWFAHTFRDKLCKKTMRGCEAWSAILTGQICKRFHAQYK
jgi:hypothetical protein